MTTDSAESRSVQPFGVTLYLFFLIFLLLAPVHRGGDQPIALLLLELAAIAFLLVNAWVHRAALALPRPVTIAISVLLVYPLLQIIPLPPALWQALPGRTDYAAVLERFVESGLWRPISVVPSATEYGWLALFPPLACFLVVLRMAPHQLRHVLLCMVIFAGCLAVLGLLQAASGSASSLYFGNEQALGTAVATFVNRNHFAGMLAMMLPIVVGLLVSRIRSPESRPRRQRRSSRSAVATRRLSLAAFGMTILACLLLTRSSVGISAGLIGLASSMILLARARAAATGTENTRHADWLVLGLVVVTAVLAIAIGAIIERIQTDALHLGAEGRLTIYWATLRAAVAFLPLGSGLSTFADVTPRFVTASFPDDIRYAYNDYLQVFLELGLAALPTAGLLLAAYGKRLVELLRSTERSGFALLQLAAGIGMLTTILHSLCDSPLRVPANAMWFATLAGVLFHPGGCARPRTEA